MEKYWKKTDILVSTYHSSNLTLITDHHEYVAFKFNVMQVKFKSTLGFSVD